MTKISALWRSFITFQISIIRMSFIYSSARLVNKIIHVRLYCKHPLLKGVQQCDKMLCRK